MAESISLTVDDKEVLEVLGRIAQRFSPAGMAPVMQEIGETLAESTQQRFSTSTGPDGKRWAPLAQSTVLARLAKLSGDYAEYSNTSTRKQGLRRVGDKKGFFDKSGRLTSKASNSVMGMKPLVETGILQDTIRYQIIDGGAGVEIGTNRFAGEWAAGAAVHQFGSKNGKIPARPFLGLSADDKAEVLDILGRFLDEAVGQ